MEHPNFKFEQKVNFNHDISKQIGHKEAYIVSVYTPSQRKKFKADYRVVLSDGVEVDVKEHDIDAA